jgi:hypothetical protein
MSKSSNTQPWNKQRVQQLVTTNDKAAVRALLVIYHNQTPSEQAEGATVEDNGLGFTGADAEILTSFAKFYERTGFLTEKQLGILRSRIIKYWRQLLAAAEAKGRPVVYN